MGGIYYITGVQLGLIKVWLKYNDSKKIGDIIDKIMADQFFGDYEELKEKYGFELE